MKQKDEKNNYDDIINLKRPVPVNHVPMSVYDRAAQFSPFAALTGFDGKIRETARLTEPKRKLDENQKAILDEKLRMIQNQISERPEVEIVFFQKDEKKNGGAYLSVRGHIKKIDEYEHVIVMKDGRRIPIEEIRDITGGAWLEPEE